MSSKANKQQNLNENENSHLVKEVIIQNDDNNIKDKIIITEKTVVDNSLVLDSDNLKTKNEFTRENIESLGNVIRITDQNEDDKLDLFCYASCSNSDSFFTKQCRGVVFCGNKVVMKTFPYTDEFVSNQFEEIKEVCKDMKTFELFDSHEGALVRMFYFNDKWFLSTHRKLNAFRSKWSSKDSFGSHFKKGLENELLENEKFAKSLQDGDNILKRFQDTLDTKNQYMFLILNCADNRIVCSASERHTIYHVGTFIEGELDMEYSIVIPKPRKHNFVKLEDVINYVNNVDIKKIQGLICLSREKHFKIIHPEYKELFDIRGNEPSIKFRYLQIRMDRIKTNMLYHLYPNLSEVFDDYENCLYEIACNIYKFYVLRFIKRKYIIVPKEEFDIMKKCHEWHISDRGTNRISIEKVINLLNQQTPTFLNRMIRTYKIELLTEQSKHHSQLNDQTNSGVKLVNHHTSQTSQVRHIGPKFL